jgi:Mce-associated membrane protein
VTPTWYDLLGVERDAPTDEIRAAWREQIADLEPGERRFRSLNEAAEVLLDPDRRRRYDESLEPEPEPEPVLEPEPAVEGPPDPAVPETDADADVDKPRRTRRPVPAWLLAVLAVLTALALGAVVYLVSQPSDDSIADATTQAQGAAERATPVILAYDFRRLDQDQAASDALMTPSYRKEYDRLFAAIKENADAVKPVVTATVVASGVIRADADRVEVLILVDRQTVNVAGTQPVSNDQVRVTMEKDGDDWLVDTMDTQPLPE